RADLRLDDRDSASEVLAPGEPERSELVRRITAAGEDHMPPVDSGLALSEAEIATLRHWIAQGARWEAHWAFVPPRADEPPPARDPGWPQNGIDRFVLARLADAGLTPNPPAPPAALLRRVTLDLTGLPPSPEDVATFAADPSDAAYERAVDRLLASPHYGERMAWPWLEAARYADTDGYQDDPTRTAWPWRDWLVRALNDNLPFDRFTIAMLAGDLLPDATPDQRLATAFLRNNAHNGEGGRIAEETRIENVFDRTETTATVWLGLTFECARCHDHKFDPITQRDYYGLFAFFDQTSETGEGRRRGALAPTMRCDPDPNAERRLGDIARELAELESRLFGDDPELDAEEHDWELVSGEHVRTAHAAMRPSQPGRWERCGPFEVAERDADTLFGHEFPPEWGGGAWQPDMGLTDGEVLALPTGQYALYFRRTIAVPSTRRMTLSLGSDDGLQLWCNGELVLQNDTRRGATPDQERAELRLRAGPNELLVKIVNTGGIGGIYCRAVDETVPDLPAAIARALAQPSAERDDTARRSLRRHFRAERVAGWLDLERQRDALLAEQRALERRFLTVSVMDELPTDRRRTTHVLERGSYRQPRDAVTADTPGFLPPLPGDAAADRLALARWLVAADHPLTARVAVNRAWQTFFGRGLVATSEDFGRQGERPTHPALLDWLARRFVASGWDVKALHRLIVTSATYRQSAAADGADFAADPHNERLARSSRRRLPAWMLRDQALALGGQLAARLGGAPVRPYQPAGVWAEATFGTIRYQPGSGDELHRR
ncbi:MAG: DUF1549 domain-containing protein, partial [Planctomycetes bacterium]|nr:DUF1549 domain-containing protein [Planctomycetota bacterium]